MPSFWKSNRASKSHLFFPEQQQQQQQQHPGEFACRLLSLLHPTPSTPDSQARVVRQQRPAELERWERLEKHACNQD